MIDADTFRSVLGRFASGVTIVTACDDKGADHGMTVSAFCSLSLDPPMVLFCVDHAASMHDMLLGHPHCAVSILSSNQEAYSRGESGAVLLDDALAHLEVRLIAHHEAGDHTVFIAQVDRAHPRQGRPLLYYRGGYAQLER